MRVATRRLALGSCARSSVSSTRRGPSRSAASSVAGARARERPRGGRPAGPDHRRLEPLSSVEVSSAEPFRAALGREAEAAAEVLRVTLGSGRYVALRGRLEQAASEPCPGPAADAPASPTLGPLVHRRLRALRRGGPRRGWIPATRRCTRSASGEARSVRGRGAQRPSGTDVVRFASRRKRVQAVLGAHQDAVAVAAWLRSWADGQIGHDEAARLARRLAAAEREEGPCGGGVVAGVPRGAVNDPALRSWM